MNTATKRLDAMRNNPRGWHLEQLQTVARQYGLSWRQRGTSHCIFVWPDGRTLPVPAKRPVKPVYVVQFTEMLGDRYV
jgi:hypothetical protein